MKAVLTRVSKASVRVDGETIALIEAPETGGVLALVGVHREDFAEDVEKMARKIAQLRLLDGERSAEECGAPVLVVSQFTLQGRTAKGRRPSWSDAARPEEAQELFDQVVEGVRGYGIAVQTGQFGAMMDVESVNQGPFTLLVDTKDRTS